jgi:RimJ/RimL family protein N-acetyltransferase
MGKLKKANSMARYFKKIVGTKCYLSPVNPDDFEKYTEWLNDPEISQNLLVDDKTVSLLREKEILEDMAKNNDTTFTIVDLATDKPLGNCSLNNVDNINQTATLGIFIGDKEYLSKGYGTEAMELLLDYGFNALNLQNIMLEVFDYNKRAIKAYEKVGFKVIGKRRQAKFFNNKRYDIIFMDILKDEFLNIRE